jgi:hypothetical protein
LRKISSLVFLNKSERPLPSISTNSQFNLPSPDETLDQLPLSSTSSLLMKQPPLSRKAVFSSTALVVSLRATT